MLAKKIGMSNAILGRKLLIPVSIFIGICLF
jgi:hypothetical protein